MGIDKQITCPKCGKNNFNQDGFETLTVKEIVAHFQCCKCYQTFCVRGTVLEIEAT